MDYDEEFIERKREELDKFEYIPNKDQIIQQLKDKLVKSTVDQS